MLWEIFEYLLLCPKSAQLSIKRRNNIVAFFLSASLSVCLHWCPAQLRRCRGAGRSSAVAFVRTEGTRSGGMTARHEVDRGVVLI